MHYVHGSDIAEQLVNSVLKLAESEWVPLNVENSIKSYFLPSDSSGILTTMIESVIPAPVEYAHSIVNLTSPTVWMKNTKAETIERYDHLNTIEHIRTLSMFFGGQPLESLFFRTIYVELDKRLFVQAYHSIENDQFKFEEGSVILAFLPSAWILDVPPAAGDGDVVDPNHCRLRLITQTDPSNTIGRTIPGFTNITSLLRNPGAGLGDSYLYARNYITEHFNQMHPDPLIKIGHSMETEWADTYCSMNEACGWTAHVKRFGMSVYSKIDINGNPIVGVKGCYFCPQPISEVLESFEVSNAMQWEPFVESASVLRRVDENLSLVRMRVRGPLSQTCMDLCLLAIVRKAIGNLGVIMFRSASHEAVPSHDTYLLPSGLSVQPGEHGGCLLSFMMQGFYSRLDPALYAPVIGARLAMSITNHLKFIASNFESTKPVRHYKSIPTWLAERIIPRKGEELEFIQKLQPLCRMVLDELSANHRLNYPHTSFELGTKRKRVSKLPQSITTINSDQIAEKRKGQFVRPFIFLVNTRDSRSKYLKRVSMASSLSFFDYLGPDILTDILQYLDVSDVIAFSQVCKNFHFFTTGNRAVWKGLFWRRYGRVYSSYPVSHSSSGSSGGGGNIWDRITGDGGPLISSDSFDDWRDTLMGKMAEERAWRIGRLSCKDLKGHGGVIKYMCQYDRDQNNSFLCTADDSVVKVWSLETNQCVSTIIPLGPIVGVQSIPLGAETPLFVVGSAGGELKFYSWLDWDLEQDNTIPDTTLDGFMSLAASTVIWSSATNLVYVFDNTTGQRARSFSDHQGKIKCMLACKNERLLYSAGKDGKVVQRDIRTDPAQLPAAVITAHAQAVRSMRWGAQDLSIVTASSDATAKFWDLRNLSRPTSTLTGHEGPITCVDVFDRYKIVTGGKDKIVRIWSVLNEVGEEYRACDGFQGPVSSVSVYRNEIYSGSVGGDLRRWTLEL